MNTPSRPDLQRLIFATSNFRYLRGLTAVPLGLFMIVFPVLGHFSVTHAGLAGLGLLISLALAIAASIKIHQFYDRHYGKVEPGDQGRLAVLGFVLYFAILIACIVMDGPHPKLSLSALWLAALFWGVYMSSAGYRWHYLLLTLCFVCLVPRWGNHEPGGLWQAGFVWGCLIVGGILDHVLLARSLPVQAGEQISLGTQ